MMLGIPIQIDPNTVSGGTSLLWALVALVAVVAVAAVVWCARLLGSETTPTLEVPKPISIEKKTAAQGGSEGTAEGDAPSMFEKILVPVDDSGPSERATVLAADVASRYGAEIVVFHACEHEYLYGVDVIDTAIEFATELVDGLVRRMKDMGLNVRGEIVQTQHGRVARAVLEAIAGEGVDLVVIGRHGHRALGRLLLGSVADKVARMAGCPVLLVR